MKHTYKYLIQRWILVWGGGGGEEYIYFKCHNWIEILHIFLPTNSCCIFMNQSWNYKKKVLRTTHLWFCLDMDNVNIDSKKWGLFHIGQWSLLDHPPEWFTVNIPCVQFQSNTSVIAYVYSDKVNSSRVTCEISY